MVKNIKFDKYFCHKYNHHPKYSYIDMFVKNHENKKCIFTSNFPSTNKNIIITSNNNNITKSILDEFGCEKEVQWITVAKHISECINMDLVVLLNTYCDVKKKQQIFDVYYYTPSSVPVNVFRSSLQMLERQDSGDEDDDLSMLP